MRSMKRRFLILAAVLCLLSTSVQAVGSIDLTADLTLTLRYTAGETALYGAGFSLYKIADAEETGELSACDAFEGFDLEIRGKNDARWRALAATLESYILREDLAPLDHGTTGKDGTLCFPAREKTLRAGLYLVLGERHRQGGYFYDAEPFLVMLPMQDLEENVWNYNVTANVKFDKTKIPQTPETVTRKVLKVWDDDGAEDVRPKKITVELLKDGRIYDTVTLSRENHWRYTWEDLDAESRWSVYEQTPEGYRASITREGITFVVTNTRKTETPKPPQKPNITAKPPQKPNITAKPPQKMLPQTGALWWPVGALSALGLTALCVGEVKRKRKL